MTRQDYLDKIKTEYGIDIQEFLDLFYQGMSQVGIAEHFGVSRKVIRNIGYKLGLDWGDRAGSFTDLDNFSFVHQNERLKYKYHLLQKKYNKLKESVIVKEEWLDSIARFLENNKDRFNFSVPKPKPLITETNDIISHVLILSDWHIGQKVDKSQVGNEFNLKVAKDRIEQLKEQVIATQRKDKAEDINVFLLGDFIESGIHDDLLSDEQSMHEYLFWVIDQFTQLLLYLSSYYNKVNVYTVYGNHSRVRQAKYYKNRYVTLDSFIYQFLEYTFRNNNRIKINLTKSHFGIADIQGFKFAYTHGDTLNSLTEQQLDIFQSQISTLKHETIPNLLIAHFHVARVWTNNWGGYTIVNGSLIGIDEYATYSNLRLGEPTQIFFSISVNGIEYLKFLSIGG